MICHGDLLKVGTAMPAKVSVSWECCWRQWDPLSGDLCSTVTLFAKGRKDSAALLAVSVPEQ